MIVIFILVFQARYLATLLHIDGPEVHEEDDLQLDVRLPTDRDPGPVVGILPVPATCTSVTEASIIKMLIFLYIITRP